MIGRTISHYLILDKLGEGGMGVVYKARDTELGRLVAIKALHAETLADEGRRKRFLQEARTASALNHPNIITIYEIAHVDGRDWIVMEYVDGAPLRSRIGPQGLPVKEAVGYAAQIASALGAAHDAGIVHRDIKPANILVSSTGLVKVADFGLAKFTGPAAGDDSSATRTVAAETAVGTVVGTVAYMSPEQAQGERLDGRSDVFSLGVVLYEMLTGRRPFQGDTHLNTLFAILHEAPPHPHTLRSELDPELERIVERALAKKREARYRTAAEMTRALSDFQIAVTSGTIRLAALGARLRRPRVAAAAVVVVLVAAAGAGWLFRERSRARWARDEAIPQVARLVAEGKYVAAFDLAGQAEKHAAADPRLRALWPEISRTVTIETAPSDAEVSVKEYGAGEGSWRRLGRSPLRNLRVPYAYLHWKLNKAGFETAYAARPSWAPAGWEFQLHPEGATPPGMVPVPAAQRVGYSISQIGNVGPFDLDAYFIDRYEVTNREYKRFVDAGGYQERKYWKQLPSWEEGMKLFRDSTGRPGPSTWEAGSYPVGQDEFPVSGVSWYEAAAYAEFAGKSLPTIAHWYRAAEPSATSFIVQASNFSRQGPARVGQYQGIGPFGTADMGGNVKEWCWNETGEGQRYLLGGAWNSPSYQFHEPDAQSPFARTATYGFRCVRYTGAVAEAVLAPKGRQFRDYTKEKPAGDEVFRAYAGLYDYEATDLKAAVESSDDSSPDWRVDKVSFAAAYGKERVPAYLYLPKSAKPPFQALVYHPGAGAVQLPSSRTLTGLAQLDFLLRSGRAVLYPVLQGTYERRLPPTTARPEQRNRLIQRVQDVRRSYDYLESRPDIDRSRLGYLGHSWGSAWGPVMVALEPRIRTAVFLDGGFYHSSFPLPETDILNFAPRAKAPVLMLNGRHDFIFPLETSQLPMFRTLGTPEKLKRHVVLDTAHDVVVMRKDVIREALGWLDQHLGPVGR